MKQHSTLHHTSTKHSQPQRRLWAIVAGLKKIRESIAASHISATPPPHPAGGEGIPATHSGASQSSGIPVEDGGAQQESKAVGRSWVQGSPHPMDI